jgi:Photosynthetic reaction centre cytochrome C subunit
MSESRLGFAVSLALAATLAAAQDPVKPPVAAVARQSTELSIQETNDRFEQQIAERIVGRENEPASQVFKNMRIDWLKTVPARRLLDIMNGGYAKALGVRCTHCHVESDFSSDDKRPKRAAREMATMHHTVNQTLAKMENLKSAPDERSINCATCHRGKIDPHDAQP